MNEYQEQYCSLCKNHCPVNQLLCNRGRNYFAELYMKAGDTHKKIDNKNIDNKNMDNKNMDNKNMDNKNMDNKNMDNKNMGNSNLDNLNLDSRKIVNEEMEDTKLFKNKEENSEIDNKEDFIMSKEHEKDNRREKSDERDHHNLHEDDELRKDNDLKSDNELSSDNEELMDLLRQSSHFLHHRRGGKRGQGRILKILAEHPEISQKDLQEILRIEPGSMSELVIKLEHKGFITRTKDETDKRMTKLMITELGLELSKELEETDTQEEQFLLSSLDSEEQQQLKALLSKLLAGWEASYEAFREDRHNKEWGNHGHCGHHHGHHKNHDHHSPHDHHDEVHREHHNHHDHKDKDAHQEHHHHRHV